VALVGGYLYRRLARAQGQALARGAAELREREKRYSEEIRRLWRAHRAEIRELETAGLEAYHRLKRERWFAALRLVPWDRGAPEVEVEAKFVLRLLQFLGYDDEDLELRTSVPVQQGSKPTRIEADWVVRDDQDRALMVVEVKAPDVALGEAVREQARSYAFRLGAPVYLVTNGTELQIYHLGVVKDYPVLVCPTAELGAHWEAVERYAGRDRVTALRTALEGQGLAP
jgi:hypothetical protein